MCGGCRQHEETVASIGARDLEATAQFEEDLQTVQASIDAEFGKDSDHSCKKSSLLALSGFTRRVFVAGDEEYEEPPGSDLFCPACNKLFKTANA